MEGNLKKILIFLVVSLSLAIVVLLGIMLKDVFFGNDIPRNPAEQAYMRAKTLLDKDPDNAEILTSLAKAEADLGKTKDAIEHMKKAIKLQPAAPMLHYTLAKIYLASNQEDEAIKELEAELIVTEDKNEVAWFELGLIMYKRKNYDLAINYLQRSLARQSGNAEAHFQLGKAYESINKKDLALAAYKEVLKYVPDHVEAQLAIQQLEVRPANPSDPEMKK